MSAKANKWIIGSFLILGTMLAGYITADGIRELYYGNMIWVYREGFFYKLPFIIIGLDFVYLTITGLVSCISFFRKGRVWKLLTNIILVNIALYFIIGCISLCDFKYDLILSLIIVTITSIAFWLLWELHKLIQKTDTNSSILNNTTK